jgi:hypothetical protein
MMCIPTLPGCHLYRQDRVGYIRLLPASRMTTKKIRGTTLSLAANMTEVQRAHCVKITNKLIKLPISFAFRLPVDPVADELPDYYQKIKNPMDLGTVVQKLQHGQYSSLDKWKDDIGQIWKNAAIYNGETSPIVLLARELAELFKRYCEAIPKTELEAWLIKVRKTEQKLMQQLQTRPVSWKVAPEPPHAEAALPPAKRGPTMKITLRKPKD